MKKFYLLIAIIFLFLSFTSELRASPNVEAPSAILLDYENGRVLYEKDPDKKMYPASTTKIMTAILCIEKGNLDDIVTVGTNPPLIERGSSQIYLIPGEKLTLEQLLYALMVESANDAAVAIAEHIEGSIEEFAEMMNDKAREIGATNTNFVNPHGLPDDNHYTTARDLALMGQYGMTLPKFREVVSTVKYTIPETNKQPERDYITNSNRSIWTVNRTYHYEHAIGIKTGYTTKAKNCFVSAAEKDGMILISAILGKETNGYSNMFTETKDLFEFAFDKYRREPLIGKNEVITSVKVEGLSSSLDLQAWKDFHLVCSDDELKRLKKDIVVEKNIERPIVKGQTLGYAAFSLDGEEIGRVALTSSEEVPLPRAKKFKSFFLYLLLALVVGRGIVIVAKRVKAKRRMRYRF